MRDFLIALLELSIQGSIVILVILALRFLFDRLGLAKKYTNILWLIPFIGLVLPWKMPTDISVWNMAPQSTVESNEAYEDKEQGDFIINIPVIDENDYVQNEIYDNPSVELPTGSHIEEKPFVKKVAVDLEDVFTTAMVILWITGVCGFGLYGFISYMKLLKKVSENVPLGGNVYYVDGIKTPFVLGVFKPHIYIPSFMKNGDNDCILEHERSHIKSLDHIKKILAFVVLCIHWFNPLVWLAFYTLEKDMEMACDEITVARIGEGRRQEYAHILLLMSSDKNSFFSVPVAFGEHGVKDRIKNIVKSKVTIGILSVLTVLLVVVLAVLFLTDASPAKADNDEPETESMEEVTTQDIEPESTKKEEETTGEPETEAVEMREFTAEELLNLCEGYDVDFLHHFRTLGKYGRLCYSNFQIVDGPEDENFWYYVCEFIYDDKNYEIICKYTKEENYMASLRPKNSLENVRIIHKDSGDVLAVILYQAKNSGNSYKLNKETVKDFLNKKYNLNEYINFNIPSEIKLSNVGAGVLKELAWTFIGDLDELSGGEYSKAKNKNDFVEETWSDIGGIIITEQDSSYVDTFFEDNEFVCRNEIFDANEMVTGLDMEAVAGTGGYYVYTLAEVDDFEVEHGVKPDDEVAYWCVFLGEPDSKYIYILYLNQKYYTKEETIYMAKSIDILENN